MNERAKAQLTPEGKFALLLILSMLPTFAIFLFFNKPELGLGACKPMACLLIALRSTWNLRVHGWYWASFFVAAAIQVPFLFYVPWLDHIYRGTALTLFGFVDFIIVWGVFRLSDRLFSRA